MKLIRDYLHHPAVLAMIDLAINDEVIVAWEDGGRVLVQLDSFMPADETHDRSERADIKVIGVIYEAESVRDLTQDRHWELTMSNAPTIVASPDLKQVWTATNV